MGFVKPLKIQSLKSFTRRLIYYYEYQRLMMMMMRKCGNLLQRY